MSYNPREYLPYMTNIAIPGFHGVEIGIMVHYKDVIGITRGTVYIEEFYKGKPVLIGLPKTRFKFNRN